MIDLERFPKVSGYRGVSAQLSKVEEELAEVREALQGDNLLDVYDEITDVLLASVTLFVNAIPEAQRKRMIGRAFIKNEKRGYYNGD